MAITARGKFSTPVDPSAVERSWRKRGFSCAWFEDPPGREWKDFVHPRNELVTVVEGQLEMEIARVVCLLNPGDEVIIPKGVRHSVKNVYAGISRWLYGYD